MSTVIKSCPGCNSSILADTAQCPECGHVFHERRTSATTESVDFGSMKTASLVDPCPHCGEMVRTGLVRCWSCNGFMREDIAARYLDMTTNPQKIIYSTIPLEKRTDYLPPRGDKLTAHGANDTADFQLSDFVESAGKDSAQSGFELMPGTSAKSTESARGDGPDKPREKTPAGKPSTGMTDAVDPGNTGAAPASQTESTPAEDNLLLIAMKEELEVTRRRGEKIAERQRKQMMVPCSCGAWIRVHEEMAGKVVRCRKCRRPVNVPSIRRKAEKKSDTPAAAAKLAVAWVEGVRFFRLAPTSIVLKPGSVADKFVEADLAITDSQLVVVAFTGGDKKKRGLMGKSTKIDLAEQRKLVRDTVAAVGDFNTLTNIEVHSVPAEQVSEIRLVQPILKAHESMFAGVPVFGDGRIAIFLPITSSEGQQAYCSLGLTAFRGLRDLLKKNFNLELPGSENGVPDVDKTDNLNCFINQTRVESIRGLVYYQQDSAFELELSGYRCKACSVVISEEGRKKNKLGGANGKGIAKAKCPKCSGKMGEDPLYRIKKSSSAEKTSPESAEA